ncbi:hypothetical protein SAMD00023353_1700040 [Rosellinia necatrix]|uniref:Transmembrane protein n=1 Tax=Rosellinia necatrix TaxID=77044 RepID=A0A1W2TKX2_ROSNE|nr:hypothetical protein SAMD00023353_1700040 [Rosellinia necatrix]
MAYPNPINPPLANENDGGDDTGPRHDTNNEAQAPTGREAGVPISLGRRAPPELTATRIWDASITVGPLSWIYMSQLEQKVPCIRSQRASKDSSFFFTGVGSTDAMRKSAIAFPYPRAFLRATGHGLGIPSRQRVTRGVGVAGHDVGMDWEQEVIRDADNGAMEMGRHELPVATTTVISTTEWNYRFGLALFGCNFTHGLITEIEVSLQPTYVVLGIFRRGRPNPAECVAFVAKPEHLFRELHRAVYRLRGIRASFFSLTHVQGFRLYQCDAESGTHKRIELDKSGVADLQLLHHMYRQWHVPAWTAQVWADWIHHTLNRGSYDVTEGGYALELVLGWSIIRISTVVLLPVLLSLAIGIYLNAADWRDLATIQTAWGTASYVVTAGGLVAALLAILSSIEASSDPEKY